MWYESGGTFRKFGFIIESGQPTDAQLAQLMREACSDAVERAREADVKFEAELENMARQYMAEYKTRYGRT